ncbi:MAG: fatty acid desaturase [Gammaproteobacteria bacterium]|nr:fatty acid desaturase [Gammaproteobacteria bacterium]
MAYLITGYVGGLLLIIYEPIWFKLLGTLLLAHTMVIAAYMVHECAHNTLFKNKAHNARLGVVLNWLTGACYERFEDIRYKHNRHHTDRADIVAFDYRPRLKRHPLLLKIIQLLEWFYIPAVELMMHALSIALPFVQSQRKDKRLRVVTILIIRSGLFVGLFLLSPWAPLFYAIAYMMFLTVMHFMDVHQHTYEVFETLDGKRGPEVKQFDREYEQLHTYSNLVSLRHPWLNLITLNFGYHNAHHERPTVPWYRLPALHRDLYGEDQQQLLPFRNLLRSYHRYRVARVLGEDEGVVGDGESKGLFFVGADGVSFLTAH